MLVPKRRWIGGDRHGVVLAGSVPAGSKSCATEGVAQIGDDNSNALGPSSVQREAGVEGDESGPGKGLDFNALFCLKCVDGGRWQPANKKRHRPTGPACALCGGEAEAAGCAYALAPTF